MAELTAIDPEPIGESVVAKLEHVLAKAKAGELSSVAIAYVYRDGSIGRNWSDLPSYPTMLGSLARLMHLIQIERD